MRLLHLHAFSRHAPKCWSVHIAPILKFCPSRGPEFGGAGRHKQRQMNGDAGLRLAVIRGQTNQKLTRLIARQRLVMLRSRRRFERASQRRRGIVNAILACHTLPEYRGAILLEPAIGLQNAARFDALQRFQHLRRLDIGDRPATEIWKHVRLQPVYDLVGVGRGPLMSSQRVLSQRCSLEARARVSTGRLARPSPLLARIVAPHQLLARRAALIARRREPNCRVRAEGQHLLPTMPGEVETPESPAAGGDHQKRLRPNRRACRRAT